MPALWSQRKWGLCRDFLHWQDTGYPHVWLFPTVPSPAESHTTTWPWNLLVPKFFNCIALFDSEALEGGVSIFGQKEAIDHICNSFWHKRELGDIYKNVYSSKFVGQRSQAERLFKGMLHLAR